MKKLLIIGSNTIHTYNYIKLVEDYFDEILLLTNKKNDKFDVNSIEIDFSLGLHIFRSANKIKKITKEFNPSVIHIHQANSYAFTSLLGLKYINIPKVLTAWGSDVLINPKRNIILKKMLEFNLKNVDVITSDSLHMANEIKLYNPTADVVIATFGIDIKNMKKRKEKIIYSNRLHESLYNIEQVLFTFSRFIKNNKDWKLMIGATGNNTEKLKKLAINLKIDNSVEFIGWVDNDTNNKIYQKASIYISIPSSDATSMSLLEAISSNCICFVSNLPANSEHILDKVNGFIEPNLDKIDLEKYKNINTGILEEVNNIRKKSYLKNVNKKVFFSIYDKFIKENK